MVDLPLIGISMGDPSGIGPEIIIKALSDTHTYEVCKPVVLGDLKALSAAISKNNGGFLINDISTPQEAVGVHGKIDLVAVSELNKDDISPAAPTVEGGRAMVEYIVRAVEMCQKGEIGAMVTCPISKVLMHKAGYPYDGHTQLIAHLTEIDEYVMMLAGERLRVSLATIHCALKDVPANLTTDKVYRTIAITGRSLQEDFGIENPRLAVASLNPHAGESGLFGTEEAEIITPAVTRVRDLGYQVTGPLPPDTLFYKAASGQFDAVIAMYHDQGLIPLKLLHFSDAVNVTLGLPIIRTSVDHGTAYDIAGKGEADASSLKAAIQMAARMFRNRESKRR
jgi:4-hydroxythreonine-4-phosphate dehydrogenase